MISKYINIYVGICININFLALSNHIVFEPRNSKLPYRNTSNEYNLINCNPINNLILRIVGKSRVNLLD